MNDDRSMEAAREEFYAYVRSTVAPPAQTPPDVELSPSTAAAAALFERLFDFRVALAGLAILFVVCTSAAHLDARRYQSILGENRYSMGATPQYLWRYDGRDNGMYYRSRNLTFWDRQRLRHTGLHVTYDESAAHSALRSLKLTTGFLFFIGLLIAGRSAWKRFQDGDDEGYEPAPLPERITPLPKGRPVFGRRGD